MEYSICDSNGQCTVNLNGSFTFSDNQSFRHIVTALDKKDIQYMELNFSGVDFVDSAALGMLLLLRDHASKRNIKVVLANPVGQVKKMFDLSHFHNLFSTK